MANEHEQTPSRKHKDEKIHIDVRVEIDVRPSLDEKRVREMIEEELSRVAAALKHG
jgi:hypothetical protein